MIRRSPAAMNSRAVARSGSRRLAAFAVPFLRVLLENGPRSHFFGALAISSFFLGRLDDVLVLALLFGPDTAYMLPARQNCPPEGWSLTGTPTRAPVPGAAGRAREELHRRPLPTSPCGGEGLSRTPGSFPLGSPGWPVWCWL